MMVIKWCRNAALGAALAVMAALGGAPPAATQTEPRYRVLVFTETSFVHDGGPAATAAIQRLGDEHGFDVEVASDSSGVFTEDRLPQYDAVVFNSNNGTILNQAERTAFERYIHAGGGYVGIHSASNSDTDWRWYTDLLAGGRFQSHPAGDLQFQQARLQRTDRRHPSTRDVAHSRFAEEEWYNTTANPRDNGAHVLLTVDESTYEEQDGSEEADDHPISWCNDFDGGRSWYTALGHKAQYWSDAQLIEHVRGGIEWAAGAASGRCGKPRPGIPTDASFEKVALDDNTANPMELAVAPDGRVFYVELGGAVKVYRPDTGAVVTAAELDVHRGNENGLLGIALDPRFTQNRQLYLFYSAPEREVQRISRFTVAADNTLDMGSEKVILEFPHQRIVCCHSAGSMDFGPDGSLYVSTGDDTAWFDSSGYSPHDDRLRGDPDEPLDARRAYDARRTAGNTNDLRGKILRIRPKADPAGEPGPGRTYDIPGGNLFPPGASDPARTRPEIYTMGHRNPFRIAVDRETGWVYAGEVGPDANVDSQSRGPRGYDEWNQIRSAGNYGWPYCIADNKPYADYDWATGQAGERFDCANGPRNDSAFNTGLETVPPARDAFVWYPYGGSPDFPAIPGGGGRTALAGDVYHFDGASRANGKFPRYYDDGVFVMEWSRNFIGVLDLDENGEYAGFERFMPATQFRKPQDMEFGPDGNIYLLEWGQDFNYAGETVNPDSGLYRISYARGGRTPVTRAAADRESGATPLQVGFSSAGSYDPDGDEITFRWDFGDGSTSTAENPGHTFAEPGVYTVLLTVTDSTGRSSSSNLSVTAGNTRPQVRIATPRPGTFFEWGSEMAYSVSVTDPEDGSIDCSRVRSQSGIFHDEGGSPHVHPGPEQTGCTGTAEIPLDSGHSPSAKLAFTVQASYTDRGGEPGAPELSGSTLAFYNPKTMQAEHHSRQSGTQLVSGGARVGFVDSGDWISYTPMDLGDIGEIALDYASGSQGGFVEVRLDAPDGPVVGRVDTPNSGGWGVVRRARVTGVDVPDGAHEVFFVFGGGNSVLDLDRIAFRTFEDLAGPQVTAAADPPSGWAPLDVRFTATAEHPSGDGMTFHWDFGDGATSGELSPSHRYEQPGTYQAVFTATDSQGRRGREIVTVHVTPPPAGCEDPTTRPPPSDEFDGARLDGCRWTKIVRENPERYGLGGGALNLIAGPGDMFGGSQSAENLILQPARAGAWTVETRMSYEAVANYQQAGLMLYGDDNNWAKFGLLHINGRVLEYVWEQNNSPRRDPSLDVLALQESFPSTLWMRLTSDGSDVRASYSTDGQAWQPLGRPVPLAAIPDPHVGLFGFTAGGPQNTATFDYFRVTQ
jgi:cytochrome c